MTPDGARGSFGSDNEGHETAAADAADWVRRDRNYVQHPFQPDDDVERIVLVSGSGCTVKDMQGREYLDARGAGWLAQVGYGRPELARIAADQMARLAHYSIYWEYGNRPAISFAEKLINKAPPSVERVRFCSSGSEAVDEAVQIARYFHFENGERQRSTVLTVRGAYHGRTLAGSALSGSGIEGIGPYPGPVLQLTPPWAYHQDLFQGEDVTDFCVKELEDTISQVGANRIAALVGEPVLGSSGVIIPPDDYWPRMHATLRHHGILLVMDEVVTAFGRVGRWFGSQQFDLDPDLIVLGKGIASGYMPIAAVLLRADIAAKTKGLKGGGSYGGHAVACAVAEGNMDIIEAENLCAAATERGAQLLAELAPIRNIDVVGDVRGLGLMAAIELTCDKAARKRLSTEDGVLSRQLREETGVIIEIRNGTIYVTPPLVISSEEVSRITEVITGAVKRLRPDGSLTPGRS